MSDTNSGKRAWAVISWQRWTGEDENYGKLLTTVEGTEEEAREEARGWVRLHSPVGIVEIIG